MPSQPSRSVLSLAQPMAAPTESIEAIEPIEAAEATEAARPADRACFGMEIERVDAHGMQWEVETTGAIYTIIEEPASPHALDIDMRRTRIELRRKIDPVTNDIRPRLVARLELQTRVGALRVDRSDPQVCVLANDAMELRFHADSLFFVTSTGPSTLRYRYLNLIEGPALRRGGTRSHSRLWTDGQGGSLIALARGRDDMAGPHEDVERSPDLVELGLRPDEQTAHMIFPARPFDLDALYGPDARPFTFFCHGMPQLRAVVDDIDDPARSRLLQHPFGAVAALTVLQLGDPRIVWLSRHPELREHLHLWRRHMPPLLYQTLSLLEPAQIPPLDAIPHHYEAGMPCLSKPELSQLRVCADRLHARGLKLIIGMGCWLIYLPETHEHLVLDWLMSLLREYDIDGFYLDNGAYGNMQQGCWLPTYDFFRRLRTRALDELDKDLYLFHHNSNDAWGGYDHGGLRAIMVDTYMNATLTGEVGPGASIDGPDDDYLRYHTCGYGFTQALAHHKRFSCMTGAISEHEKNRALAQELHGAARAYSLADLARPADDPHGHWQHFLQHYHARKAAHAAGELVPGVAWPPAWYRPIADLHIQTGATWARIEWSTDSDHTDYSVSHMRADAANGIAGCRSGESNWWGREKPSGKRDIYRLTHELVPPEDYTLRSSHAVELVDLEPDTEYRLRIRSANQESGPDEILWGWVGTLRTSAG